MAAKIKQKRRAIVAFILLLATLFVYIYQASRPTIIFHTHTESGYLGKVSTLDGNINKLYSKNHKATYKLPHIWNWKEEDEIAIFTSNYNDLFKKEDITFWRLEVFLDENGKYQKHTMKRYWNIVAKMINQ